MIPCAKSRWFSAWFAAQARGRLQRSFSALHLRGADRLRQHLARGPVLVVSNHSAWWDSLVAMVLTHHFVPADGYAMMDADNLRRRPFFAKVGGFGVDRSSRRDGAEALRYAEGLLDGPGRLVWIFPQGQERPLHEPLRFFGGAARLALRDPALTVLPVGLAYAFGAVELPSVYVAVGEALPGDGTAAQLRRAQQAAVEAELSRVQRELSAPGTEGFEAHPLRRPGWVAHTAERALAVLCRPFVPGLGQPEVGALMAPAPDSAGES